MNSFGLGLVLNFTDNATAGVTNATRAFQQLDSTTAAVSSSMSTSVTSMVTACYALDSVGDTLVDAGSSIISMYSGVAQSVIDAGLEMQSFRMQLTALYGSSEAGEAKMNEIKDYAMSSVFEIQSLIPAVTMMKTVGIEAMDEITTSSGNATQKLLDYAADLAAMMPNMRNTYGTGVKAAMGAFKEYIAEGNALSLKRGAGLDITAILGESKGSTIEERTQQVADLIEKLNIVGYTAALAGTPMQRMSNMQDALFNTLTKIADSGVFEVYCGFLERLSDWVFALVEDEETFNIITGVMADTVTTLLSPLNSLLDYLIENGEAIIAWVKENPKLTKNILLTVAAIGGLLIAGGSLLKLISAIGMASAGMSFLKTLPSLLKLLGSSFGGLITKALPFVALASVAYFAWSQNLFGIRDAVTKVMNDLGQIFSLVGAAWDGALTEEEFQKAQELGILPLIESLLQLKYYWDFFVQGFKEGFKSFFEGLVNTLNKLGIIDVDVNTIVASLGEFLKSLVEVGAEDKWSNIGKHLGEIAASLLTISIVLGSLKAIIPVIKVIGTVLNFVFIKPLSLVGKLFKPAITGAKSLITVLKGGQGVGFFTKLIEAIRAVDTMKAGKNVMNLSNALKIVFGTTGVVIAGVVSLIAGVVTAVTGFVKQLTNGFSWFWEIIKWIGIALGVVGAILLGVAALPAVIVGAIIGLLTLIIVLVKQYWNEICAFFSTIGSWIYDNVIKPVADFFVMLWDGIVKGVMFVVNGIVSVFSTIATWVYDNVIAPIVFVFTDILYPIIAKIVEIVMKIVEIIVVLISVFVKWIYNKVIKPIGNFFSKLWNSIVNGVKAFLCAVKSVIGTIVNWINTKIIYPIANFFSNLWDGIKIGVTNFIGAIKSFFEPIVTWIYDKIIVPIGNFFASLWEGIKTAFSVVADTITSVLKGAVNGVLSFVCGIINGVISAINFAIGIINAIPGVNIEKITLLELPKLAEGGVVDRPTTAIIGEAGQEAVVPLENNTEWIDKVAEKVAPKLNTEMGHSAPAETKQEVHNDYSVTFSAGSIVIQLANATEAELEKAAEKLMKIIERKQQLKGMAVRA